VGVGVWFFSFIGYVFVGAYDNPMSKRKNLHHPKVYAYPTLKKVNGGFLTGREFFL